MPWWQDAVALDNLIHRGSADASPCLPVRATVKDNIQVLWISLKV